MGRHLPAVVQVAQVLPLHQVHLFPDRLSPPLLNAFRALRNSLRPPLLALLLLILLSLPNFYVPYFTFNMSCLCRIRQFRAIPGFSEKRRQCKGGGREGGESVLIGECHFVEVVDSQRIIRIASTKRYRAGAT